jgi:hypothetical protein
MQTVSALACIGVAAALLGLGTCLAYTWYVEEEDQQQGGEVCEGSTPPSL